jgi:hypothetical protein
MDDHARPHARTAPAPPYHLFTAFWGGLLLVDVGRAAHAPAAVQLALIAVLGAACCVHHGIGTALAVAGIGWLVVTGFVVNSGGDLSVRGPGDVLRLVVLGLAAITGMEVRR